MMMRTLMGAVCILLSACTPKGEAGDRMDQTSLVSAVMHRDERAVTRLLRAGADVNERDDDGATPLILATGTDQYRLAEQLLEHGADVFAMDRFGHTAGVFTQFSTLGPDSGDGAARLRLLAALIEMGYPSPIPDPKETKRLAAAGKWPPRR
jgi:hypothetical protein